MRFYFEGNYVAAENGKLAKINIFPSSNSRTCREIFVLIAKEIKDVVNTGDEVSFGLIGEKKTPMIFPLKTKDSRILVMGNIPQPKHRSDGYLDTSKCTGKILDESRGGGAWGAGSCFLAILEEGQRIVSNRLIVWENKCGELIKSRYDSEAEYELKYESPDIELI